MIFLARRYYPCDIVVIKVMSNTSKNSNLLTKFYRTAGLASIKDLRVYQQTTSPKLSHILFIILFKGTISYRSLDVYRKIGKLYLGYVPILTI